MIYTFLYDEQRATFLRGNGRGKTLKKCKVLMCFVTLLKICRKDDFNRGNKKISKIYFKKMLHGVCQCLETFVLKST